MLLNFKNLFKSEKSAANFFNIVLLLLLLSWLIWFYSQSLKPLTAEVKNEQIIKTSVEMDQNAYRSLDEYFKQVSEFVVPDFAKNYENPEPFREYQP